MKVLDSLELSIMTHLIIKSLPIDDCCLDKYLLVQNESNITAEAYLVRNISYLYKFKYNTTLLPRIRTYTVVQHECSTVPGMRVWVLRTTSKLTCDRCPLWALTSFFIFFKSFSKRMNPKKECHLHFFKKLKCDFLLVLDNSKFFKGNLNSSVLRPQRMIL